MRAVPLRLIAPLLFGAVLTVGVAPNAHAQRDNPWVAYYGCWQPSAPSGDGESDLPRWSQPRGSSQRMRCVLPVRGTAAAQLVTVRDGQVTERRTLRADGGSYDLNRDGCEGSETASPTGVGARIAVRGGVRCDDGPSGVTSAVHDLVTRSAWVEVSGVRVGKTVEARAQWFRRMEADSTWPAEVVDALGRSGTASELARVVAAAEPNASEIARVASTVDDAVVRAWLVARSAAGRPPLSVNAHMLESLADAGVSGEITDVLVALANPEDFELRESGIAAAAPVGGGRNGDAWGSRRMRRFGMGWGNDFDCLGPWGASAWGFYSPVFGGYSPLAFGDCGGMGFMYGRQFALGSGFGWGSPMWGLNGFGGGGGWFWRPIGTITPVPVSADTRARLVNGRGYAPSGGSSGGGGRVATGRGSSGNSGGGTANATGRASGGASSGSSSGSGGGRTAVRKP